VASLVLAALGLLSALEGRAVAERTSQSVGIVITPAPDATAHRLRVWSAAVADRNESPATILALGDSVTEGLRASTAANRWTNLLQDELRAAFPTSATGTAGGVGYLASYHAHGAFTGPSTTGTVRNSLRGLGYRALTLHDGSTVTYSNVTGTTVRVWFASVAFSGPLQVSIDGRPSIAVPTFSSGSSYHDEWVDLDLGGPGRHQVVISRGEGGFDPDFGGIQVFDGDENTGVRVIDAAKAGALTTRYTAGAAAGSDLVSDIADWVEGTEPSLAIVALGVNEWQTGQAPATFQANLQIVIDELRRAQRRLPIVLVAWYRPFTTSARTYPWSDYVDAMERLVTTNGDLVLADFSDPMRWPAPTRSGPDGYYADGLHPSDAGHAAIADQLAQLLSSTDLFPPDTTAPTVELESPVNGAVVGIGRSPAVRYSCADEPGGSGLASCVGSVADGAPLPTQALGDAAIVVTATDNAGHATVVEHTYRVARPRPDARVRHGRAGPLAGDDVYDSSGVRQSRRGSTSPGGRVLFTASFENDAAFADRLQLTGGPSSSRFVLRFRADGVDVTRRVLAGRYRTPVLPPGARHVLEVTVRPPPTARIGSSITGSVTAASLTDLRVTDRVGLTVTVR